MGPVWPMPRDPAKKSKIHIEAPLLPIFLLHMKWEMAILWDPFWGPCYVCRFCPYALYPGLYPWFCVPLLVFTKISILQACALAWDLTKPPTHLALSPLPPPPDELAIPGQAPLPSHTGTKYVAQGTLDATAAQSTISLYRPFIPWASHADHA